MPTTISDLSNSESEFLICRESHKWEVKTDYDITLGTRKTIVQFTRMWVCERCKTEKHITVDATDFTVVKRRMVYPDGYLLEKGHGRVLVADVRRAQMEALGYKTKGRKRGRT